MGVRTVGQLRQLDPTQVQAVIGIPADRLMAALEQASRPSVVSHRITHDVDEAALLSDRVVMMTNGPAAGIGEVLDVKLPRPRKRLELVNDREYLRVRSAILEFLYARRAPGREAA